MAEAFEVCWIVWSGWVWSRGKQLLVVMVGKKRIAKLEANRGFLTASWSDSKHAAVNAARFWNVHEVAAMHC